MMGHRTKQFKLFAPTSLDSLVPPDNFYRRLEAKLDLSFVRDLVRDCYGELGRPSFDATQVEGNASMDSLRPRLSLVAARGHVQKVFAENAPVGAVPTAAPPKGGDNAGEEDADRRKTRAPSVFSKLLETYRHARRSALRQKNWYVRVSDWRVSRTDPDAQPMRTRGSGTKLGYHNQYVVDGGKARIILATLVTAATVMENSPMLDLARWVRFRWRLRPKQATGAMTSAP